MVSYREFVNAFRDLRLNPAQPVIVHASLTSIGEIRGGAETLIGALLSSSRGMMAPAFTYKTMLTPEAGPEDNAIQYGMGKDTNRMAEFFTLDMPAAPLMGVLPELIRKHPNAKRSSHPILSFTGINVDDALVAQTFDEPLAPIGTLAEQNAIVLLAGVNLTVNTSLHWAERVAGRKQFTRWALTPQGVRECPGFPGCSDGFEMAAPYLNDITCSTRVGNATFHSIQLAPMIQVITALLRQEPDALLCGKNDARCEAVRRSVQAGNGAL